MHRVSDYLAPDQQTWTDLGKLIRDQVPGKDGKTIPPSVTSGVYQIEDLDDALIGPLYEAKLIVDRTNGYAAYGCYECCGADSLEMLTNPMGLQVKGSQNQSVISLNTCYGQHINVTNDMTKWSTADTSIATASGRLIAGVGPGSTNQLASGQVPTSGWRTCPFLDENSTGGTNVFNVAIIGNPYVFVGSDSHIIAANTYFATNGNGGDPQPSGGIFTATSSDSKDTISTTQSHPPKLTVTTQDQSASTGDRVLTFSYSLSSGASIQLPTGVTARQFAYLTNNNPSNQCTLGYGTDQTYIYTVYTHPDKTAVDSSSGLDGTPVAESFSPALSCDTVTGNGALDANGQFSDHIQSACQSQPIACTQTNTQTLSIAGFQVRTNTLAETSSGVTYTNDGPTQ
jgi:hypothetical protein